MLQYSLSLGVIVGVALELAASRVETRLTDWMCDGEKVAVPHTWNAVDGADGSSNVFQDADNSIASRAMLRATKTYRTALAEPKPGKRYFVRSGGAAITATVCVNGRVVGRHVGPVTAFTFEITDFLREHDNILEIVVDNHFDEMVPPVYADYTIMGGLYRPVWLIETDPVCIDPCVHGADGVVLETNPDTGDVVARLTVSGATNEVQRFRIENPELWTPENPKLYDLALTVRCGSWSDTVRRRVGFKKAEFREDGFYLNGKMRKLHGVNYHQEREGLGWALTEESIREDLLLMKKMGADAIRTAHYPHSAACYDLCDELGLLAWIETPASGRLYTNELFVARLLETTREMVAQNCNHASLMAWSLFNELYGISDGIPMPKGTAERIVPRIQKTIKAMDASHPTVCAAVLPDIPGINSVSDVYAFNTYPGWYGTSPTNMTADIEKFLAKSGGRTTIGIGEYGSGASIHHHENPLKGNHPKQDGPFHPEEAQTHIHRIEYARILAHPKVWGSYIWAFFDFASDNRCEGDHKGVNDKGLVTHDHRTPKDAYYFYKVNWNPEPMLYLCSKRMVEADAELVTVMGFSNVGAVTLKVNGRIVGTQNPDEVKSVVWNDVSLIPGVNEIELLAGGRIERCTWRYTPGRTRRQVIGK